MKITVKKIVCALLICLCVLPQVAYAYADEGQEIMDYIEKRKEGTAGLAVGVFDGDDTLFEIYYGSMNVEKNLPVSEDSVFEWGSLTKLLTWVSIMQLEEQGLLNLSADITNYLPEGFLAKLSYNIPITLLDLMNHRAGFQEVLYKSEFADGEDIPELSEMLKITEPPQIYQPGTVTAYSNWGCALAGYIVERVSGLSFGEYVNNRIFRPLGMEDTAVLPDLSDNPGVAKRRLENCSYYYDSTQKENLGSCIARIGLYPAGSATGTLSDFMKFAKEFCSGGRGLFQGTDTMERFLQATSHYSGRQESRVHHGLWSLDMDVKLLGHGGNTNGYSSSLWFDPISGRGVVVMTNEVGEIAYNYGIAEMIFGSSSGSPVPDKDLTGIYYNKRSLQRGTGRITKYMYGIMPIFSGSGGVYNLPGGASIISQGNGVYRMNSGNGLSFNIYRPEGTDILESYTGDYEKLPIIEVIFVISLIVLMLSGFVFNAAQLVTGGLKLMRKEILEISEVFSRLALLLSAGLSGLFAYLWLFIESYEPANIRILSLIMIGMLVLILVNLLWQIYAWMKGKHDKMNFVRTVFSVIPVIATIFFQTFMYWV